MSPGQGSETIAAKLNSTLWSTLEPLATKNSLGIWVGIKSADSSFGLSFGYSEVSGDGAKKVQAQESDVLPLGSLTKAYIAVSIMKLVDVGTLELDTKIEPYVDKFLRRANGTNLTAIFHNCKKEKGWVCPQKNITKATSDRSSDDGGSRDDDFLAVSNDKDDDESSTNRKQYIQKVTIRHILGMSSGLQSYDYIADQYS